MLVVGVILVRIFPHFPALPRISSSSVRLREMGTRITLNTDTFHAVRGRKDVHKNFDVAIILKSPLKV